LPVERDAELVGIEKQIRVSIRDAVNRTSRKPFHWGGLDGYEQLEAIAQALHTLPQEPETAYLRQLTPQVDRALEKNCALAQDVGEAHSWLARIGDCLHYPSSTESDSDSQEPSLSSRQVRRDMEALLSEFQPDLWEEPAQAALYNAWHRKWRTWSPDLLNCYDIPGLPADNLRLESFFNKTRNHERRISGRQSTRPLRYLGAYQVLFIAESEQDLLEQIRQVPLEEYKAHRRRLQELEAPRQHLYRLHRKPLEAMQKLLGRHSSRRAELALQKELPSPSGSS
jgi:hypothetical protein